MKLKNYDGLSAQIYTDLKKKIEEFEYKPNDRISESMLSKVYDVSRTPIKHSLSRLENEGLIDVRPQRGTYVSKIDTLHIHEFFTIRMLLELSILDDILAAKDKKLIDTLMSSIDSQKNLIEEVQKNADIDAARVFFKLDNAFHKAIFDSQNKGFIWDFIMSQSSQFNRYRLLTVSSDIEYLKEKTSQHLDIVKYLSGEIKINPKVLYNEHLFVTLEKTIRILKKKYPDYFLK